MRYLHLKSGGVYDFVCNAFVEADNTPVVVYQCSNTGKVWTRPYREFHDGRFLELPDPIEESPEAKAHPHG